MMTMSRADVRQCRNPLAALLTVCLVFGSMGLPAMAEQTATFVGGILDPDGKPAEGFRVVMRDVVSGKVFTSPSSTSAGQYSMSVPVGGRYKLEAVVAPDQTRLPVQDVPPLSVRSAGNNRLDVRFTKAMAPAVADTSATAPSRLQEKPTPPRPSTTVPARVEAKKPWWKTSGGVIGIVAGVAVVAALVAGGNNNASPSQP